MIQIASEQYTLEQAHEDIADLRGTVHTMTEFISTVDIQTATLEATGAITATGGTESVPTLITTDSWQSLGTLAGATVNYGRYMLLSTGFVHVQIDLTFGGSTAVPITFSNTVASAMRPPGSVDIRAQLAQTNAAGSLARIFVGSVSGGSAGQVQIAAGGNVIGTYSVNFQYPII